MEKLGDPMENAPSMEKPTAMEKICEFTIMEKYPRTPKDTFPRGIIQPFLRNAVIAPPFLFFIEKRGFF